MAIIKVGSSSTHKLDELPRHDLFHDIPTHCIIPKIKILATSSGRSCSLGWKSFPTLEDVHLRGFKDDGTVSLPKELTELLYRIKEACFSYGNYRNYYGYRVGQKLVEDPRLKVFKKEWFEGKDCLDIGCNNGIVTIQIARKFNCRSILGVDIDSDRVDDAYWNLRREIRLSDGNPDNGLKCRASKASRIDLVEASTSISSSKEHDLHAVVSFKRQNFIFSHHPPDQHYDTILCLSVAKWIHLNWGDDGLITLFSKIWKLLNPGGILVLEPQPWKSYEANYSVSETTKMNFRTIKILPEDFQEILLDKIGFRTVEALNIGLADGNSGGFNRPILVFQK
ncbi:probable RNA methyltransferase At5g51130 [Cucumis sativus]|uniref:probable RNA methyltransferase At5g51130 n=1 Tax=Cucumis sativus TaxID=3659 RepID=UPI0012F52A54|nr:probable RNA methyltransferase At5g51130 [Cucumis sativus]